MCKQWEQCVIRAGSMCKAVSAVMEQHAASACACCQQGVAASSSAPYSQRQRQSIGPVAQAVAAHMCRYAKPTPHHTWCLVLHAGAGRWSRQ